MRIGQSFESSHRREFLQLLGVGALGLALPGETLFGTDKPGSKPMHGVFPIAQTPFTDADKLDLDALAAELKFIDRGRVHGFVWPQMASEWYALTEKERLDGAEAIVSTGKSLRPVIVIGVQAPDIATAVRYAKHAEKTGADAIISLPISEDADPQTHLEYYKEVGKATGLPLFAQAVGNMSVELLIEMYKAIPNLRYIKDEGGNPLMRIAPLREQSSGQLKVWTGANGRTFIDELRRGFSGTMPTASFADLYAQTFDLWQEGKRMEAMEMHAKTLLCLTEAGVQGPESMKYILYLRGVFKTYRSRPAARRKGGFSQAAKIAAGGAEAASPAHLDGAAKKALEQTLDFVKPYLRA